MINTDTMRESGDFITLIGTLIDEKQQKIQLSYRVQSEEELIQIKNLRGTAFILWASGEFEEPERARNPYNFDQTAYFKSQRIMGKFTIQKVKKFKSIILGVIFYNEKELLESCTSKNIYQIK